MTFTLTFIRKDAMMGLNCLPQRIRTVKEAKAVKIVIIRDENMYIIRVKAKITMSKEKTFRNN